jgi:hypothetical protein
MEKKEVAPELMHLVVPQLRRGLTDEISLRAVGKRWTQWFDELPEPTAEQLVKGREIQALDEARRQEALNG